MAVNRSTSKRCGSIETSDGKPCRNLVRSRTKKCQSGHIPLPQGFSAKDPFAELGIDTSADSRKNPKLKMEAADSGTIDLDDIEGFLNSLSGQSATRAFGAAPENLSRKSKNDIPRMRKIPKKTPEDMYQVVISTHAAEQLAQVGASAQKALDRIIGVTHSQIKTIGKELPERNGKEFWRVRTGKVAVLFEIDKNEVFVQGFAPRDRPPRGKH